MSSRKAASLVRFSADMRIIKIFNLFKGFYCNFIKEKIFAKRKNVYYQALFFQKLKTFTAIKI